MAAFLAELFSYIALISAMGTFVCAIGTFVCCVVDIIIYTFFDN